MFISTKSRSAGNLLPTSLAAVRALFDNVLTIPHYELVSKLAHYPVVIGHLTLRPNSATTDRNDAILDLRLWNSED